MSNYRKLTEPEFKGLVTSAATSAKGMWIAFTSASIAAFDHANAEGNTHSPDRIKTLYKVIIDADAGKELRVAFERACAACCAWTIGYKDGEVTHKFMGDKAWSKIAVGEDPILLLESKDDGLRKFKATPVKRGSNKNPITAKNQFQIVTNDIAETMDKIFKIDSENPKILELKAKFEALKTELDIELNRITPKTLSKVMAPSTVVVDETPASAVSSL